jgi:hypothetical protein
MKYYLILFIAMVGCAPDKFNHNDSGMTTAILYYGPADIAQYLKLGTKKNIESINPIEMKDRIINDTAIEAVLFIGSDENLDAIISLCVLMRVRLYVGADQLQWSDIVNSINDNGSDWTRPVALYGNDPLELANAFIEEMEK